MNIGKSFGSKELLIKSVEKYGGKIVFASSMGAEDQVITDMIVKHDLDIPIFTIDTGRLFPETYDLIAETVKHYNIQIGIYFPKNEEVEKMVNTCGINLFYKDIVSRRKCCAVRKLEPLERGLKGYYAWVCGLRREQSVTRKNLDIISEDNQHGMIKINPLLEWSEDEVWDYIHKNNVPYNKLHDKGFPSIGCACCTRAVKEGEDIRSGRWWWESPEKKECGLHWVDGKIAPLNRES